MESQRIRLGVIVPMLSECTVLFDRVAFPRRKAIRRWEVHEADTETCTIGVMVTGTGLVMAAIATEALIAEWNPDALVLVGCAGSISPDILPGDVAIGRDIAYYSSYQTLSDGTVNLDVPGIRFRTSYILDRDRKGFEPSAKFRARFIQSSEGLLALAREASHEAQRKFVQWPKRPGWPLAEGRDYPKCVEAVIGTADQINSDPDVIRLIRERYGIDVEECEGAAVGQVALFHELPFIILRGISDNEAVSPVYGELIMSQAAHSREIETESTKNVWTLFQEMVKRVNRGHLITARGE